VKLGFESVFELGERAAAKEKNESFLRAPLLMGGFIDCDELADGEAEWGWMREPVTSGFQWLFG